MRSDYDVTYGKEDVSGLFILHSLHGSGAEGVSRSSVWV